MTEFAKQLKEAKKAAGMTQQKIADRMLIPKRTIEDWERGVSVPPEYVQRFVLNELEQIAGDHPAIIDRDEWEAAQAKLREKQQPEQPPALAGYKWQDGELVVNEKEAELVKQAFNEFVTSGKISMETEKAIRRAYAARQKSEESK